jgi:hypothetical protein
MKTLVFLLAAALAGTAAAQDATKSEPRRPLNLRLDDASSAAPRITFGHAPSAQTKEEREKGLPDLGGKPNEAYDRPASPDKASNSVIPKAMNPETNGR